MTLKGGVISRYEKVIPYKKIQHVIIYESFWGRVFGLSTISIETARDNIYESCPFIPYLKQGDAEKLKKYLISVSKKYKPIAGV